MNFRFATTLTVLIGAFSADFIEATTNKNVDITSNQFKLFEDVSDPLYVPYLPITISRAQSKGRMEGFINFRNLEILGLSKIFCYTQFNTTSSQIEFDFRIPKLIIEGQSYAMSLDAIVNKEEVHFDGQGELENVIKNFRLTLSMKIEEVKGRIRVYDLKYFTHCDVCTMYWENLVLNGDYENEIDWDYVNDIIGTLNLDESYLGKYNALIDETLAYTFNLGHLMSNIPDLEVEEENLVEQTVYENVVNSVRFMGGTVVS